MTPVDAALLAHAHARRDARKRQLEAREHQRLGRPYPWRLMKELGAALNRCTETSRAYSALAGKPPPGEEDDTDSPTSATTHRAGR